jgi:hypothetical protein
MELLEPNNFVNIESEGYFLSTKVSLQGTIEQCRTSSLGLITLASFPASIQNPCRALKKLLQQHNEEPLLVTKNPVCL